jgi:hypothetical protein
VEVTGLGDIASVTKITGILNSINNIQVKSRIVSKLCEIIV